MFRETVNKIPDNIPKAQTSAEPTSKHNMQTPHCAHPKRTWNNIPNTLPFITNNTQNHNKAQRVREKENVDTNNYQLQRVKINTIITKPADKTTPKQSQKTLQHPMQLQVCNSNIITHDAINLHTSRAWEDTNPIYIPITILKLQAQPIKDMKHYCAPAIHPTTDELINKYEKFQKDETTREIWEEAMRREFGSMAQGNNKTGTPVTNPIFVMNHAQNKNIPKDCVVTYTRIVVDF